MGKELGSRRDPTPTLTLIRNPAPPLPHHSPQSSGKRAGNFVVTKLWIRHRVEVGSSGETTSIGTHCDVTGVTSCLP